MSYDFVLVFEVSLKKAYSILDETSRNIFWKTRFLQIICTADSLANVVLSKLNVSICISGTIAQSIGTSKVYPTLFILVTKSKDR
jgi:hypothetical protein